MAWPRVIRAGAWSGSVLAVLAGLAIVPEWLLVCPISVRARFVEWFLRGVLVAYGLALLTAGPGTLLLVLWMYRDWRRRRVLNPKLGRGVLAGLSVVFGLILMELGALAWGAWAHRMPVLPTRFKPGPADELSIVVIGGSSALGFPFDPWLSVGQIVGWKLEQELPGRRVQVSVLAERGNCLEQMHQKLESLDRRPDILIVYSGHNEFQARYQWARGIRHDETPASPAFAWLFRASLRSPLCRLIYEATNRKLLSVPPEIARHQLIDPPLCSPSESAAIVADFRTRLESLAEYCERIRALPVFIIPPGNEAGSPPNRSCFLHGPGSAAERARFSRDFEAARRAEGDPQRSIALYEELLRQHPEFAETHFRLARQLEQRSAWAEAKAHYLKARDLDGFPQRCSTALADAYRTVTARHAGTVLIDGPAVVSALSPTGIVDDNQLHDLQHPALIGHVALAQAVLDALRTRETFGWSGTSSPQLDASECAAHFGLGAAQWSTVCYRESCVLGVFAKNRFDPSGWLAKAARFADAMARIPAGAPLETVGIPGLGPHPVRNDDRDWARRPRAH